MSIVWCEFFEEGRTCKKISSSPSSLTIILSTNFDKISLSNFSIFITSSVYCTTLSSISNTLLFEVLDIWFSISFRPKKFTKVQLDHAMDLLENNSYNRVAEITGISKSTLIRESRPKKTTSSNYNLIIFINQYFIDDMISIIGRLISSFNCIFQKNIIIIFVFFH